MKAGAPDTGAQRPYGVRDVERLLGLSRGTIRSLIAARFVTPARGPRGAWQFSFQDLIVLRTAQALADAKVPQRRIMRSMRELRRNLPASMPLSGLRIGAVADSVVVREGDSQWQAESGQYLLEFGGDPADGSLAIIQRDASYTAQEWFAHGATLEGQDTDAAETAYRRAIAADPAHVDAHINLGRVLHDAKRYGEAESVYRAALERNGRDPVLLFNLGVLLDDLQRTAEAVTAYEAAVKADPRLADGHYNLALLYQKLARPQDALRHMARYRVLIGHR